MTEYPTGKYLQRKVGVPVVWVIQSELMGRLMKNPDSTQNVHFRRRKSAKLRYRLVS